MGEWQCRALYGAWFRCGSNYGDCRAVLYNSGRWLRGSLFEKEKDEITLRSSAAEYLTYVSSVGDQLGNIEMDRAEMEKFIDNIAPYLLKAVISKRQILFDKGIVDDNFTFTQDWAFTSPSLAAAIVVGYSINGRNAWKNKKGISLKEIEER